MANKKKNQKKKTTKKLDKLSNEKKDLERKNSLSSSVTVHSDKNTSSKRRVAVNAQTKKKLQDSNPTKKKQTASKRRVAVSAQTKKKLQNSNPIKQKEVVSEETIRLNQLEEEIRRLYQESKEEKVVEEPIVSEEKETSEFFTSTIEEDKDLYSEFFPHEESDVSKDEIEPPKEENYAEEGTLFTDVAVNPIEDDEIVEKGKIDPLTVVIIILSVIFFLLVVAFIAFVIYVCTY